METETQERFVSIYEKVAMQEGMAQGLEQGKAEMLLNLLKYKFNYVPDSIKQTIESATLDQIDDWSLKFVDAKTIDQVFDTKLNGH